MVRGEGTEREAEKEKGYGRRIWVRREGEGTKRAERGGEETSARRGKGRGERGEGTKRAVFGARRGDETSSRKESGKRKAKEWEARYWCAPTEDADKKVSRK